ELSAEDALYAKNELLFLFGIKEPVEIEIDNVDIYSVLDELFEQAVRLKLYEDGDRLLFEGRIMGMLMPRPSAVIERFDNIAAYEGPMKAAKWLQKLENDATYLRRPDLDKNIKWEHHSERGNITITINLAKPEKTEEEIKRAKAAKTGYPKCPLCFENLGFFGNAAMSARQHIRVIPIELNGEDWFMQFSPYEYFDEHIIAVSKEHRPMHLDESSFARMIDFVALFPDYFIGSNAPLPIVGGSILAHDHYQGGKKVLPVFSRPARKYFSSAKFPDVKITIVDWYNSVVRFESNNKMQIVKAAEAVRSAWDNYSNENVNIIAKTDEQHNTVTPIAYKNADGQYAIIL
ncbi:MAG: galactose-1-phosphate uridylyltransferase, partial [Clostridia bacterium]|nr:galactose-1-phosphate uridylyltransferase [Clostridia bacterium]